MPSTKRVIQSHHISYDPEVTVRVYRGEHECLTKIDRYSRKTLGAGFIRALKAWIALNEHRAEELT